TPSRRRDRRTSRTKQRKRRTDWTAGPDRRYPPPTGVYGSAETNSCPRAIQLPSTCHAPVCSPMRWIESLSGRFHVVATDYREGLNASGGPILGRSNAASGLSSLTTGAALPVVRGSNHLTQALELAAPVYIAAG